MEMTSSGTYEVPRQILNTGSTRKQNYNHNTCVHDLFYLHIWYPEHKMY